MSGAVVAHRGEAGHPGRSRGRARLRGRSLCPAFTPDGRQINPNLTNYIMPTSLDMPKVEVDIVDSYDPTGPFGAKGVGEPTCVATAAAICNAIHDAVGVRFTSLPATAEKVYQAMKARRAQEPKALTASPA